MSALWIVISLMAGIPVGLWVLYIASKLVGYGYNRGRHLSERKEEHES